jgi:hypothetical protein
LRVGRAFVVVIIIFWDGIFRSIEAAPRGIGDLFFFWGEDEYVGDSIAERRESWRRG